MSGTFTCSTSPTATIPPKADSRDCVKILKEQLLPTCNMFGYCQVASAYGSGNFINVLHEHLRNHEKVLTSRVNSKDDIYDSIKTFLRKGTLAPECRRPKTSSDLTLSPPRLTWGLAVATYNRADVLLKDGRCTR
jgi:hypothetical protein